MHPILENILVMVLTIIVPITIIYLVLVFIGWGLKMKSGGREQQGLTDLWIEAQKDKLSEKSDDFQTDDHHDTGPST